MLRRTIGPITGGVVMLIAAACGGGGTPSEVLPKVDPRVMSDVVEATFMVPGTSMRRAMRLNQFERSLGIQECGGEGVSLDGTYNRMDQSHFPDLELIRARGFGENAEVQAEDRILATLDGSCPDLMPNLPTATKASDLDLAWADVYMSADQDLRLESLRAPMAQCLSEHTSRDIDVTDPVNSFLHAVSYDTTKDGTTEAQTDAAAVAYADCSDDYFATYRRILLETRPAMVEKHREVLEAYAAELTTAGYVP